MLTILTTLRLETQSMACGPLFCLELNLRDFGFSDFGSYRLSNGGGDIVFHNLNSLIPECFWLVIKSIIFSVDFMRK